MNNILLRPIAEKDIPLIADILQDDRVNPTYMVPDLTREDALKLSTRIASLCCQEERYVRGIYHGDMLVGLLNDVGIENGSIELGWVIAPEYQGNGYATAAVRAAIDDLFRMGYTQVVAGAFAENKTSMRVMEKVGMVLQEKTEIIEYRGQTHQCIYYARSKQ